jgi:hypothetical protein
MTHMRVRERVFECEKGNGSGSDDIVHLSRFPRMHKGRRKATDLATARGPTQRTVRLVQLIGDGLVPVRDPRTATHVKGRSNPIPSFLMVSERAVY